MCDILFSNIFMLTSDDKVLDPNDCDHSTPGSTTLFRPGQLHWSVPLNHIRSIKQTIFLGALSFSMFFGMMFGAVGWGTCSDLMGRSTAFNATLFFTALFGILAGFAPNFFWLCVVLFFLGSAVGVCTFGIPTSAIADVRRRDLCLQMVHSF